MDADGNDLVNRWTEIITKETKERKSDQVGGDHYIKHGDFEPIKVFAHWFTPEELKAWARISAVVYLIRAGDKGQDQDVMKAIQTLQKTMDLLKEKE